MPSESRIEDRPRCNTGPSFRPVLRSIRAVFQDPTGHVAIRFRDLGHVGGTWGPRRDGLPFAYPPVLSRAPQFQLRVNCSEAAERARPYPSLPVILDHAWPSIPDPPLDDNHHLWLTQADG